MMKAIKSPFSEVNQLSTMDFPSKSAGQSATVSHRGRPTHRTLACAQQVVDDGAQLLGARLDDHGWEEWD